MIGVYFKGRLGNQLFQYAYFLYLKSTFKDKTFFFPNPHHAYLAKYFDLGTLPDLCLNSKAYSAITRIIPFILRLKDVYVENFVAPRVREVKDGIVINGYFQTDWYLKQIEGGFNPPLKKKYIEEFNQKFGELFSSNKTIAVHIRRTDYLHYGKRDVSLPITYFQQCLNGISNLDEYKVLFVSDDLDYVKAYFPARPNFIFSSNNEITDFQIIQNADIAIISNSTFAWWAAYLSPKKNLVYAPKNWLGFRIGREHPKGIMTDKFNWCEVPLDAPVALSDKGTIES